MVDGDTFDVGTCGDGERVRILGIDAPEIAHDGAEAQCGSDAATIALTAWVGRTVTLSFDHLCTDAFGRTLAWPWLDASTAADLLDPAVAAEARALFGDPDEAPVLLSAAWLIAGLARRYDPGWETPTRYDGVLKEAEQLGWSERSGLWGSCDSEAVSGR